MGGDRPVPTAEHGQPRELRDGTDRRPVAESRVVHDGMVWDIRRDTIDFAPGVRFDREYVAHTGAVAVLAVDDDERALLIRQYRHPAGGELWEIPAGLLDIAGEDPAVAATRELQEEADLVADSLEPLLRFRPSPGGSDEEIRIYLARGLRTQPDDSFVREGEEAELTTAWVPVREVVDAVLRGDLSSGTLVAAILAYSAAH